MWSETVGLRTRPVWHKKIGLGLAHFGLGLGLAVLVFCKTRSCKAGLLRPMYFASRPRKRTCNHKAKPRPHILALRSRPRTNITVYLGVSACAFFP